MSTPKTLLAILASGLFFTGAAQAQNVAPNVAGGQTATGVTAPPSVDNGVANGIVKPSGSPSVSNGVANGIVKQSGAPSVGNGIGNGVMKSTTTQQ